MRAYPFVEIAIHKIRPNFYECVQLVSKSAQRKVSKYFHSDNFIYF